jgi:single-strand DNA-binding protein
MNIAAMIGNAASDPELRYTSDGKAVATFRLAVNRPGTELADFFTVVCFGRQAEVVNKYVTTGRRLGIEGRLAYRSWETKDGQKRSTVEVVANRVSLLGSRADRSPSGSPDEPRDAPAKNPASTDEILL